jgi:hypothetical protein
VTTNRTDYGFVASRYRVGETNNEQVLVYLTALNTAQVQAIYLLSIRTNTSPSNIKHCPQQENKKKTSASAAERRPT